MPRATLLEPAIAAVLAAYSMVLPGVSSKRSGVRHDHSVADLTIALTPEIREFVTNPPPGSATARARDFGYNVVALAIKLATTTPDQRLSALDERIADVHALRKGMR